LHLSLFEFIQTAFTEQLANHPREVRVVQHFDGVGYPQRSRRSLAQPLYSIAVGRVA
jgi:hypothetical protein